ncbi:MAG: hypothetical protein KAR24_03185 [Candidatus Pacebacteria bacterium]|nr:hypothetical protein [Candidatus Paceibacterota bacterium]
MEREEDLQQDIQERVEKLEKLVKDNNKILHRIQRHMRVGALLRVVYWVVIIGSMLGLYYYLQPFVAPFVETYNELIEFPEKIKTFDLSAFGDKI